MCHCVNAQVHRQTAATTVKHVALGVSGLGCEDAIQHLMNFVWPNVFEESPHVINAMMEAIEGMMVALGPLPPSAPSSGRLLEDLQFPLHFRE